MVFVVWIKGDRRTLNEGRKKGVGASRVVRWIGHRQDVLVATDWKPIPLAESGVFQLLKQLFGEVRTASLVVRERHPQADKCLCLSVRSRKQIVTGVTHRWCPSLTACRPHIPLPGS